MPNAKLIIDPAPWVLHQNAWDQLMMKVNAGATLLISGKIDADEHWTLIPDRNSLCVSNTAILVHLAPCRAALMLIHKDGHLITSYNTR